MLSQGINIWGGEQFAPLFGAIKRFFTPLQSSLTQHYTFPEVVLAGDFEIETSIVFGSLGGHIVCHRGEEKSDRIAVLNNQLLVAGTLIGSFIDTNFTSDDKLHLLRVDRVGTLVSVYLNGVFQTSGTFSATLFLNTVGGRIDESITTSVPYFSGILANVKITNGTTLTHDLPLDEDFALTSIAVNKGTLGAAGNATTVNITESELFTLHTETDPDEWRNFDDTIIIPIAPRA